MKVVWKYQLLNTVNTLCVPKDSKLLLVFNQHDSVCLWFEVESSAPSEERKFFLYGTGHEIDRNIPSVYVGTAILHNGELVLHVYEEVKGE